MQKHRNNAIPEKYDIDLARISAINQLSFINNKLNKIQSIDEEAMK